MKDFLNFFKAMLSSETDVSSKRFISIFTLFIFTVVVICALVGINVPEVIIYALVSLILGGSVMTLVQSNNKSKNE